MRDINPEVGMSVMVRVVVGPDVTGIWAGANHRGMVLLVPQGKTYIPWEKVVGLRWWVEAPPPETEPAPETDGRDYEREARELSVRLTQALNRGSRLQEYAADLRLWVRANRGTGKTTDDILDTVADIAGKIEQRLQEGVELEPALQSHEVERWRALSTELAAYASELSERSGQSIEEETAAAYRAIADEISARFLGEEWQDRDLGEDRVPRAADK